MTDNQENTPQEQLQHPPHLMLAFFPVDQELDLDEIESYLLDMDADGCETVKVEKTDAGFTVTLDELVVQVMKAPEPDQGFAQFISAAEQFPEEFRKECAAHKVVYQVVATNVASVGPLESQIALLKVGVALCDQDALCVAFPFAGTILPAAVLEEAANTLFGESDKHEDSDCSCDDKGEDEDCGCGGDELSIWDMLREQGQPQVMLMNIAVFHGEDKQMWMMSRGFTFCGFADVLIKLDSEADVPFSAQFIEGCISFQISNQTAFNVGNEIAMDENVSFRFVEPPQIRVPFQSFGCLLAEKIDKSKPAKSKIEIVSK